MNNHARQIIRVLVVEDNRGDAELVRRYLERGTHRYEAKFVTSVGEALAALVGRSCDVVLLDLFLPDSGGLETVQRVHDARRDVPIVVLTSIADDEMALAALDYGAQDYLVKGTMSSEPLDRAIRYAIQRQCHRAEIERLLEQVEVGGRLLEKKNRRLKRLYHTARRFVNNVSHEFRTPLTVIKEYVSLLSEGLVGAVNPEQARFLNIVGDRADDLNRMVDDMLDVSRMDAGLMVAAREACQLTEIVDHVRAALERKAALKDVRLDIEVPDNLPDVYCDPEKVGRVIVNFIVNAIKFSDEEGQVKLWAEARSDTHEIVVCIADNGPGIDPADRELIFRRFRQLGPRRRRGTNGIGLGLSIVRELVELNLGRVWVEGAMGGGSKFSFTLPLADPHEVMRRYLARQADARSDDWSVAVLSATTRDGSMNETADDGARDVEAFLNFLLRRNDLLFRSGPARWTLALACPEQEIARFLQRAEKLRREMDRNRPAGPLPEVEFTVQGIWDVASAREEILSAFDVLAVEQEHVCA